MREIPDAEKPVGHPHLAGSTFLQLAQPGQLSQGGTIRTCARAVGPGKRVNVSLIKPPPKSWHRLEGDGPNLSSYKRSLSGFPSGHDKSILPARGFPRWLLKRKFYF